MTLNELQQVKKDREQGIIISPQTWMKVLETAIAQHSQEFAARQSQRYSNPASKMGQQ